MANEQVILRWVATERISPRQRRDFEALLSDEERACAVRFYFDEDRLVFLAAHALTRALLHEFVGRCAQSFEFRHGPFGKPEPILASDEPSVSINLSHTKGLAVVAAGIGTPIGVDVEWSGRRAPLDIAERFFAPEERALIQRCPEDRREETFYVLWTLKEAFMKATGMGTQLALDSFAFALDPPRLIFCPETICSAGWQFHVRQIGPDHIVSVAIGFPGNGHALLHDEVADIERIAALSASS